jgi:hypothetical protein
MKRCREYKRVTDLAIYTAPCIMFWMRAYPLYEGKWGGGWALEMESFLGPVKLMAPYSCRSTKQLVIR